jgi:hypothetical protein
VVVVADLPEEPEVLPPVVAVVAVATPSGRSTSLQGSPFIFMSEGEQPEEVGGTADLEELEALLLLVPSLPTAGLVPLAVLRVAVVLGAMVAMETSTQVLAERTAE